MQLDLYTKENILIYRLLLPLVIYFILIWILKVPFGFYPLTFGLIVGLVNWNIHRYKPVFGVFLSVFISYLAFFIAYYSFYITGRVFSFMKGDSGIVLGIAISTYIIAPLLVFLFYRLVFKLFISRITVSIITISIILLVLYNYLFYSKELNQESLNSFTIWQMVMILALQLIIYQNKIFTSDKK